MDFMISQFCEENNHQIYNTNRVGTIQTQTLLPGGDDSESENRLPPEMELGNIEYKARLVNMSDSRLEHLVTQMKWRLREGQGEAIYELGVEDAGHMSGLNDNELEESLETLQKMADTLDATMVVLTRRDVTPRGSHIRRTAVEVLIRKIPESQQFIELRLAILGGVDVGKSTLCGVMTQGILDDGHGKTRLNLFRYPHEVRTGKTSSVCLDVIGFDTRGKLVNYSQNTLEEIAAKSAKLVNLIDLCGDAKYQKTTIQGLSGYQPHFACLLISAVTGPTATTKDHLGLAAALNVPIFVIVTKKDLVTKQQLEDVMRSVKVLLTRAGMTCTGKKIKSKRDAVKEAGALSSTGVVPILSISSVTGEGFHPLRCFLHVLSPAVNTANRIQLSQEDPLFTIEELFSVPHVGTVVGGMMVKGKFNEGDAAFIGPFGEDGRYHYEKVQIGSIRRSNQPVRTVQPGEAASIAVNFVAIVPPPLRRGMVLIPIDSNPEACFKFTANLFLLAHRGQNIKKRFQGTVYVGSVRQTATIEAIDCETLQQGAWATVTMRFQSPEYVRVGSPLIFRHGKTKGMGEVTEILPLN